MKTQSTHTPGPWKVRIKEPGVYELPYFGTKEEDEANARLIAAAPSLYDALKEIEAMTAVSDTTTLAINPRALEEIVKKAIAQAEGRE